MSKVVRKLTNAVGITSKPSPAPAPTPAPAPVGLIGQAAQQAGYAPPIQPSAPMSFSWAGTPQRATQAAEVASQQAAQQAVQQQQAAAMQAQQEKDRQAQTALAAEQARANEKQRQRDVLARGPALLPVRAAPTSPIAEWKPTVAAPPRRRTLADIDAERLEAAKNSFMNYGNR